MGWESRGSYKYYYRKERSGSRVRSIYVGRGEMAHLDAALFAMQKEDRRLSRMKEQQELEAIHTLELEIIALSLLVSTLIDATLIADGFHQHRRQWRRQRRR